MDINFLRTLLTVAAMASFLAIVWWAYAPSRKSRWQDQAILDNDDDRNCPPVKGGASDFCERGVWSSADKNNIENQTPHSPSAHAPLYRGAAARAASNQAIQ